MNTKVVVAFALVIALFLSVSGYAQDDFGKKRKSASLDGATGLFKTWDAESLRSGEANYSFGFDHYNRDPGVLKIQRIPVAVAIGFLKRFEFFESMDVQKRVRAYGVQTYRVLPGRLPRPATTLKGAPYFTNEAPFVDVPKAMGRGDLHLGLKFNLMSEERGNRFSMALAGFFTLPGQTGITGLNRGLSTGEIQGGYGYLFSKTAGRVARLHLNVGANFVQDPEINEIELANLQHEFIYRGGGEFPSRGIFRFIAEVSGKTFFGKNRTPGLNPKSPVDLIFGLRFYPRDWISLGAGYQASLNHVKENEVAGIQEGRTSGMVAQVAFGARRYYPPTVRCTVARPSIIQDETTTIRAGVVAPDAETLSYSWSATGGKIVGSGDTATFDATGIAPGTYTVTVSVYDGHYTRTCSTDITVIKKNLPPTVTCEPTSATVTQGDSVTVRAIAQDPNNDQLTYTWTVNGQSVAAAGPSMAFGSAGRQPGNYTIAVSVSDGEFTATSSSVVTVRERIIPNQQPTVECLTTTVDVASGGSVELRVRSADPDNDRLTTAWTATGGTVSGSGDVAAFNASGVRAGSYTVTASADDGRGGKASCSMTVNVSERLSLTRDNCGFFAAGQQRLDNCAKAMLDDVATRMQNEPRLNANIIGYTDSSSTETRRKGLGERRARAVADYLQNKGIDASRLKITDGGVNNPVGDNKTAAGRKLNRRVEIELSVR